MVETTSYFLEAFFGLLRFVGSSFSLREDWDDRDNLLIGQFFAHHLTGDFGRGLSDNFTSFLKSVLGNKLIFEGGHSFQVGRVSVNEASLPNSDLVRKESYVLGFFERCLRHFPFLGSVKVTVITFVKVIIDEGRNDVWF